jgi:hypothetical protein
MMAASYSCFHGAAFVARAPKPVKIVRYVEGLSFYGHRLSCAVRFLRHCFKPVPCQRGGVMIALDLHGFLMDNDNETIQ